MGSVSLLVFIPIKVSLGRLHHPPRKKHRPPQIKSSKHYGKWKKCMLKLIPYKKKIFYKGYNTLRMIITRET